MAFPLFSAKLLSESVYAYYILVTLEQNSVKV